MPLPTADWLPPARARAGARGIRTKLVSDAVDVRLFWPCGCWSPAFANVLHRSSFGGSAEGREEADWPLTSATVPIEK